MVLYLFYGNNYKELLDEKGYLFVVKKIAFLVSGLEKTGGIETVVKVIANKISENYNVIMIGIDNGNKYKNIDFLPTKYDNKIEYVKSILIRGINKYTNLFFKSSRYKILEKEYFSKKTVKKLITILNENNIDICIGVAGYNSMLLGKVSEFVNVKCYGWQHNSYEAYFENKYRYLWHQDYLFKSLINKLEAYIVLTQHDSDMLLKKIGVESTVIANPRSFSSNIVSELKEKNFMAAGRLTYAKGFDVLIEAFSLFAEKDNDWNLKIYGEGEERKKLENIIKNKKLDNRVFLMGNTDNIKEAFLNSSVFCLSSRWEGMPMIILEALEMGMPIIAFDITAMEPLIDNKINGVIVKQNDIKNYADVMCDFANNVNFRKQIGKNAKEKAESFSIDNIIVQWEQLFN